jgi:UDP-N-acetylmuramate--alanine ligase
MNILKDKKHIFFVGIGGIGMSGIAEILLERGYSVSGSDRLLSDITVYLAEHGAKIYDGHDGKNLVDVDLLVYSSAIPEDNPERQQATILGVEQIRRAEMLAHIMADKMNIAIGGTHGKTTTTALCSKIVIDGGLDPTVVVGGKLKNLKTNARLGHGDIFITEADEYDRSFLALSPDLAVLTTLESDHLDCYEDIEDIKKTFIQFANKVSDDGFVVCCVDNPGIKEIIPRITSPVITYGMDPESDYRAVNVYFKENGSYFDIQTKDLVVENISIQIPGNHNVLNALAAFTIADILEISLEKVKLSLHQLYGVDRRFEIKCVVNDVMIIDDYAHHPTEVAATISAARSGWGRNLIVVFQPHLYSRTRDFYREFTLALAKADKAIIADIYPAREEPIPGIESSIILDEAEKLGFNNFKYLPVKGDIEDFLIKEMKSGDMLITMGAGDIWTVADNVVKKLKTKLNNSES